MTKWVSAETDSIRTKLLSRADSYVFIKDKYGEGEGERERERASC